MNGINYLGSTLCGLGAPFAVLAANLDRANPILAIVGLCCCAMAGILFQTREE